MCAKLGLMRSRLVGAIQIVSTDPAGLPPKPWTKLEK